MNQCRFLFIFMVFFSVQSWAQTESNYTPPPMFGTPVVTPQQEPEPQSQPAPIQIPAPTIPLESKPVQPPYATQQNVQERAAPTLLQPVQTPINVAPTAPPTPAPKQTPLPPVQTKPTPVKSASPEDLLNHPVTAAPSPNTIDPLMASQIAKSKMPQPKAGEVIDDTGVDPSKVRYPNQKAATPLKPAKPIVEDTPKKTEKPKTKSKNITTEQQKMPVVTTKKVEELSIEPMANVKNEPAPNAKQKTIPATLSTKQSLAFTSGASDITPAHKTSLGGIVSALKAKPSSRAQILSYATPTNATGSMSARRVSLTRGLAIRTYLLSQGVDGARIDVRALGDQKGDETAGKTKLDQADIIIME